MADAKSIERNKDKLNLSPCIDFVAAHIHNYRAGLQRVLALQGSEKSREFANSVKFDDLEALVEPQVSAAEARKVLSVMPESLVNLSKLTKVQYIGMVPVPIYNEEGNFSGRVDWVNCTEFPREQDHPSRVLVGLSNGEGIYPTPIPRTVSKDEEAVKMYQFHVFLHEFFHTIDYPRREAEKRSAVLLECDGNRFTLQDFWEGFEKLYLSQERKFVSRYAATYADRLNEGIKARNKDKFNSALGEQICESFVGYILGLVPNDAGSANFREAHPEEYKLIDQVYRARVLSED